MFIKLPNSCSGSYRTVGNKYTEKIINAYLFFIHTYYAPDIIKLLQPLQFALTLMILRTIQITRALLPVSFCQELEAQKVKELEKHRLDEEARLEEQKKTEAVEKEKKLKEYDV